MRTLLITLTLLFSSAALAESNPAQQAPLPVNLDNAMQALPQLDDNSSIPAMTPEMLRLLMQQAERQAGREVAQARADTSNARINGTQRQQQ